jgi:hypothetical protein
MKFIKKINEFFGQEKEIERDDIFPGNDEEDDFSHSIIRGEEDGHDEEDDYGYYVEDEEDEEDDDFSHEEENWGDEESSSLGTSRISSFNDYSFDEPSFGETESELANKDLEDEMKNFKFKNDDEDDFSGEFDPSDKDCDTCEHDDENEGGLDSPETDETSFVESFKSFNEKKKDSLQAFLDKKSGKKSKKSEEDEEEDEKSTKGGKKESMKKAAKDAKKK